MMKDVDVEPQAIQRRITAEMRYLGQGYEVEVELNDTDLRASDPLRLRTKFEDAYHALFGMRLPQVPVEAFNWRVTSRGPVPDISLVRASNAGPRSAQTAITGERPIYVPEQRAFAVAAVYDRYRLASGMLNAPGARVLQAHEAPTAEQVGVTRGLF